MDAAFFSEEDVTAATAAASDTLMHLMPQQAGEHEEWDGLSDGETPSSPVPPALPAGKGAHQLTQVATAASDSGDDECHRLVRLINAATSGNVHAMDELIEALEV
jgi:hypothetical protein